MFRYCGSGFNKYLFDNRRGLGEIVLFRVLNLFRWLHQFTWFNTTVVLVSPCVLAGIWKLYGHLNCGMSTLQLGYRLSCKAHCGKPLKYQPVVVKARVVLLLCTPEISLTDGVTFFHELYFKEVVLGLYWVGRGVILLAEWLQLKVW